jgi:hypothetical protein
VPAFEDTVTRNSALVRKALQGAVLLAHHPSGALVSTLTATDGITVPAGYESVGWISDDGTNFGSEESATEVMAWGSGTFLRRDITSQTRTIAFTALETKRLTTELKTAQDLSGTTMSAEGEVVVTGAVRPPTKYWRVLSIATDGDGDQRYYLAKFYPKASVTDLSDEAWTDGEGSASTGVTMTAYVDDDAGYSWREFLFGPGALAAAADMGWAPAGAPQNLAASGTTATTTDLTWDAVDNTDSYLVEQSTDAGATWASVTAANGGEPTTNSTTVAGLTASTSYLFRVRAVRGALQSDPSATVSVTTTA